MCNEQSTKRNRKKNQEQKEKATIWQGQLQLDEAARKKFEVKTSEQKAYPMLDDTREKQHH